MLFLNHLQKRFCRVSWRKKVDFSVAALRRNDKYRGHKQEGENGGRAAPAIFPSLI